MEDKILIKSKTNQTVKNFLKFAPIILFVTAALISIYLAIPQEIKYYSRYGTISFTREITPWHQVLSFGEFTKFFILFVLGCLCLLGSIIIGIMYLGNRNSELIITENNVKGKTFGGKEVVLPLHMVSSYSTERFLSIVAVATASGITKFALIGNIKEIGTVLAQKINERQQNTQINAKANENTSNAMDDLVKLKSLMDAGIISQEEFDAKKKQLLGL